MPPWPRSEEADLQVDAAPRFPRIQVRPGGNDASDGNPGGCPADAGARLTCQRADSRTDATRLCRADEAAGGGGGADGHEERVVHGGSATPRARRRRAEHRAVEPARL